MTIWTNWDPLTKVIVGSCYKPGDLDDLITKDVKGKLDQILSETSEDLDNLEKFLLDRNIDVLRPNTRIYKESLNFQGFTVIPTAPIVPRDQYMIYGNTIIQTYTSMPDRYVDCLNYTEIFNDLFDQGYNWISQPPPNLIDLNSTDTWWNTGPEIYNKLNNQILWHTATMFKCGDALITNTSGPGTCRGLSWIQRNLSDVRIIENGSTINNNWGHIDHGWFMIDDDTIVCKTKEWIPNILRDKKIIEINDYVDTFAFENFSKEYKNSKGRFTSEWINRWLTSWVGYMQRTDFDTNVLVLDSENILFSKEQPRLFEFLNKQGINCHHVTQRHSMFWEAGIHCLTLDVERTGNKRKIC
jgi:N-dimethylarginine dimethylaminohydrolase